MSEHLNKKRAASLAAEALSHKVKEDHEGSSIDLIHYNNYPDGRQDMSDYSAPGSQENEVKRRAAHSLSGLLECSQEADPDKKKSLKRYRSTLSLRSDLSIADPDSRVKQKVFPRGINRDPLGIHTKSTSINSGAKYIHSNRSNRIKLLENIKRLFIDSNLDFRVNHCLSFNYGSSDGVELVKSGDHVKILNVTSCGSVWICPVCSARIASERRRELSQAVESRDLYTALVTITIAHNRSDRLADLMSALNKSIGKLRSGRFYQDLINQYGIVASATSLEVTHGSNGWHPHKHIILFFDRYNDSQAIKELQERLIERYTKIIAKSGYYASSYHSIDVRASRKDVTGYIAKWSLIDEISNVQAKSGRRESLTSWELAQLACSGDREARDLFFEYAQSTFGKRSLSWSRGARKLLGIGEEKSDEEIAQEQEEEEQVHIVKFTISEWKFIERYRLIGEVYHLAERSGADAINDLFIRIRGAPLHEYAQNCTL